jgi:hypothetical protein
MSLFIPPLSSLPLFSRRLLRSVIFALAVASGACAANRSGAQTKPRGVPQFAQPTIEATGGNVSSFITGDFDNTGLTDILYVNPPVTSAGVTSVTVGQLLQKQSYGFINLTGNQIAFPNTTSVAAAVADFDGDGILDYAFATSPTAIGGAQLCIYYGTAGGIVGQAYSTTKSGCMTFPILPPTPPNAPKLPSLSNMAAIRFTTGGVPGLVAVDSVNRVLYTFTNSGQTNNGSSGILSTITLKGTSALPVNLSGGPFYIADLNGDGKTDFILNTQTSLSSTGHAALAYLGNGDGTFQSPQTYNFDHNVWSMLLHDMDGDGHPDLVVEGDQGVIEIFHGNPDGTFNVGSEGGTGSLNGLSGNGGHLIAAADVNHDGVLDLITATPAGVSVLFGKGNLTYALSAIYNLGPGRSAYALDDFNGDTVQDIAVGSPAGIAVAYGNANGTFQTSLAYSALAPALSGVVGEFRTTGNPNGSLDAVVVTATIPAGASGVNAAVQAQFLTGNGDGTFSTFAAPTNTVANYFLPPGDDFLWSNLATGDFNGDGIPDLAYSLTGFPLPYAGYAPGVYLQYGNGDGTFNAPVAVTTQSDGAPTKNTLYGTTTVGDFNGDGIADLANLDAGYDDTLLGQRTGSPFSLGLNQPDSNNTVYSQVAAGFFTANRTNKQDLIFQEGTNLIPFVNGGDGIHFTTKPALANPPSYSTWVAAAVFLADMDGNGTGDVVAIYHNRYATPSSPDLSTPNELYVWYGNGDGTFGPPYIATLSRNYYLGAIADMNGDGAPDLVLSDGIYASILYNLGTQTFGNEQQLLAGEGISSISLADINGDGSVDIVATNGGFNNSNPIAIGALSLPNPPIGPTEFENPVLFDVDNGGITVLLNTLVQIKVTGTLTASPEPSPFLTPFTLTSSLVAPNNGPAPTGTVQFAIDGANFGSPVTVSSSTATLAVPASASSTIGQHNLSAVYSGDINYAQTNLAGTHAVSQLPTTTTLTPTTPLQIYYGQAADGVYSVQVQNSTYPATGTITVYDNGVAVAGCTNIAFGAQCPYGDPPEFLSAGTHALTVGYNGDTYNVASLSNAVLYTVQPDVTTASLVSSLNPAPQGQPVTFTFTDTGNFAPPSGAVTFSEFFPSTGLVALLGSATLTPGTGTSSTASLTSSNLPVGTDTIIANYNGTQNFPPATDTINEVITPLAASTMTLTSSVNPSTVGQNVIFTATVVPAGVGPVPTGAITFLDGTSILGTATLNAASIATFATSTLALGNHNISANYPGDINNGPSSAGLVQVVAAPIPSAFTLSVTPTPISVGVGLFGSLIVTVTPVGSFNQPVTLSCASLPTEAACTFGQATIAGGGNTTLQLSTTAPHTCGTNEPYFVGRANSPAPFALPMLAGLIALILPGHKRWLRSILTALAVAALFHTTACGTCTDLGTAPGTYSITVTGTASATQTISQTITLKVTI